jgi:hypothetical protein
VYAGMQVMSTDKGQTLGYQNATGVSTGRYIYCTYMTEYNNMIHDTLYLVT